jgi:hypothetical protein
LDCEDSPHIGYCDIENGNLKYARWLGSHWEIELVDATGDVGRYVSLAIDHTDQPLLSYYDASNENLRLARKENGGWEMVVIDEIGAVGKFSSLAVDDSGFAHVSYLDESSEVLKYAHQASSGWDIDTIDTVGFREVRSSIVLDALGTPRIAYRNDTQNEVRLAEWGGSSWRLETIDSEINSYDSVSLIEDSQGNLHVAYGKSPYASLAYVVYARRSELGWEHENVAWPEDFWNLSLALHQEGSPQILYTGGYYTYPPGYEDLFVWLSVKDSTGSWHQQAIHRKDASVGNDPSLAIDSDGFSHIAYCSPSNSAVPTPLGKLNYATNSVSSWTIEFINTPVARNTSLDFDILDQPHISFVGAGLQHAYKVNEGWQIESIDSSATAYSTLRCDQSGKPRIGYKADHYLRYAASTPLGWALETVDSLTVSSLSLALDDEDLPHIAYFSTDGSVLMYAHQDLGGWATAPIDTLEYPGMFEASIALDEGGLPHISYVSSCQLLRYAFEDVEGWTIELVDSIINGPGDAWRFGYGNSLVIDDCGVPHIAYSKKSSGPYPEWIFQYSSLHAYRDASGWHMENAGGGYQASLVIDEANRPCLALHYRNVGNLGGGLIYGWRDPVSVISLSTPEPEDLRLACIGPLPSSGRIAMVLTLPATAQAHVSVFDLKGRGICSLFDGQLPQGNHRLTWLTADDSGRRAPSGTYIISAEASGQRVSERVVLIR